MIVRMWIFRGYKSISKPWDGWVSDLSWSDIVLSRSWHFSSQQRPPRSLPEVQVSRSCTHLRSIVPFKCSYVASLILSWVWIPSNESSTTPSRFRKRRIISSRPRREVRNRKIGPQKVRLWFVIWTFDIVPSYLLCWKMWIFPWNLILRLEWLGSGKLIPALALFFRSLEGTIEIDGLNIGRCLAHELRSALAIVPQSPTLFEGTVRSNLDPFARPMLSAGLRWNVYSSTRNLPNDRLYTSVLHGGKNWVPVRDNCFVWHERCYAEQSSVLDEASAFIDQRVTLTSGRYVRSFAPRRWHDCASIGNDHWLRSCSRSR